MNDETVMTLIAFGGWVALLCFALCVAGWIGDSFQRRHEESDAYLREVVEADRDARERFRKAA
jgi:hypothetical protein